MWTTISPLDWTRAGPSRVQAAGWSRRWIQHLRLELPGAVAGAYSDAQIDDYSGRARPTFPWRPPLKMAIRARFSHLDSSNTDGGR